MWKLTMVRKFEGLYIVFPVNCGVNFSRLFLFHIKYLKVRINRKLTHADNVDGLTEPWDWEWDMKTSYK